MENIVVYGGGPNDESGEETRGLAAMITQRLVECGIITTGVEIDWNYDRPTHVPDSAPENTTDIVNAAIDEFYS